MRRCASKLSNAFAAARPRASFRMFTSARAKTLAFAGIGLGFAKLWHESKYTSGTSLCQGTKVKYQNKNVTVLTHPIVPFLISKLRDPNCSAADFRIFADRIMTLLIEEALAQEPMTITTGISSTGGEFDYHKLSHSVDEY